MDVVDFLLEVGRKGVSTEIGCRWLYFRGTLMVRRE